MLIHYQRGSDLHQSVLSMQSQTRQSQGAAQILALSPVRSYYVLAGLILSGSSLSLISFFLFILFTGWKKKLGSQPGHTVRLAAVWFIYLPFSLFCGPVTFVLSFDLHFSLHHVSSSNSTDRNRIRQPPCTCRSWARVYIELTGGRPIFLNTQ